MSSQQPSFSLGQHGLSVAAWSAYQMCSANHDVREHLHQQHVHDVMKNLSERANQPDKASRKVKVGIIGGGVAGLYTALMLKHLNEKEDTPDEYEYHIYEANDRIGGRIYTYRFNNEPDQYFEAGAMRLPNLSFQAPVFDLINYLNEQLKRQAVTLIPYTLSEPKSNFVYVNNIAKPVSNEKAKENPTLLGFGPKVEGWPDDLLRNFLQKDLDILTAALEEEKTKPGAFVTAFRAMFIANDNKSLQERLLEKYSDEQVNYIEVMTTQTNQMHLSYVDNVMMNIDFGGKQNWFSIANGMDTLPEAMLELVERENVTFSAKVIEVTSEKEILYKQAGRPGLQKSEQYDKILFALPPASLRMIKTPKFSPMRDAATRSINFEPLHKIGVQFKTKFWKNKHGDIEAVANGGQSITDLPSRWIVYPSYGNEEKDKNKPGVLLLYAWNTDAQNFVRLTEEERIEIALRDLQTVYPDVDIYDQFMAAKTVNWVEQWCMGDALFQPGQFKAFWDIARSTEDGFYFAGEHLSPFHTWISGAIHSSLHVCAQFLGLTDKNFELPWLEPKKPLTKCTHQTELVEIKQHVCVLDVVEKAYQSTRLEANAATTTSAQIA